MLGSSVRPTPPGRRKRRVPSCSGWDKNQPAQPSSKKQELQHPTFPPARFWDNLSEIPLTRNALRELDQRNTKVFCGSAPPRNIPRRTLIRDAHLFPGKSSPAYLKRFARHGGPDLTGLRECRTRAAPRDKIQDEMSSSQSSLGRRKRGLQSPEKRGGQSTSKSSALPQTTSTRSTGPYDRAFQQHLT
ncbi:hypothetical protein HRG_014817 [Hirsutella rhossiliensis]